MSGKFCTFKKSTSAHKMRRMWNSGDPGFVLLGLPKASKNHRKVSSADKRRQNKELEKSYCRGIIGVSGVTGKRALAVEIAVLFPELTSI